MKKLATTGLNAHLIGQETVHHFFHMDVEGKSHIETGTLAYEMVNATDIIVIDQFFMLDAKTFAAVNRTLRDMAPSKNDKYKPYGGKHIILMGDPAQLPAIRGYIFNTDAWKRFEALTLCHVTRQNDPVF